jgi:hypothetical protein
MPAMRSISARGSAATHQHGLRGGLRSRSAAVVQTLLKQN